jgi:hypothetical protein
MVERLRPSSCADDNRFFGRSARKFFMRRRVCRVVPRSGRDSQNLSVTNRHNIRRHPVLALHRNLSPIRCLQRRLQVRQLASTAQAFFELGDAEELRLTRVHLCLARGEHFAMPFWRFDLLLSFGERSPEPFHCLKPFGCAQAGHFFFQFKNAHRLE